MNKYLLPLFILMTCTLPSWAKAPSEKSMKLELSQVEQYMTKIKRQITQDNSSRKKIFQSLAVTEKQLGKDLHQLHQLKQKEQEKKQAISELTARIAPLKQQLHTQQLALANHLRARHRLGAIRPWEWLLHQDNPKKMTRLFVFYHYLFQADQRVIEQVRNTTDELEKEQSLLTQEQNALKSLEDELSTHHKHLTQMQREQRTLLNTLDKTIRSKRDKLKSYQQDKARLERLLKALKLRSPSQLKQLKFKHSGGLHYPLKSHTKHTKPLNQGLVFLVREGTPVLAVASGKVIFSDWLKGYGLLIIIDHGGHILSLYAHNASLFVTQGSTVKQGQQVATVGHTGGLRENGLYFEVRRRGRAIPPRQWMS